MALAAIVTKRRAVGQILFKNILILQRKDLKLAYNNELVYRDMNQPIYIPSGNDSVSKIPEEWKNNNKD